MLPNGDVTVAEALQQASGAPRTLFDYAMLQPPCAAPPRSATAPTASRMLRDADGDGVAESATPCSDETSTSPSAWRCSATPSTSATPTACWSLPTRRARRASPRRGAACQLQARRALDAQHPAEPRDGQRLYVGVGSLSNIAEHGFEAEEGRACIYELDLRTQHCRIFAAGLRNPVGMAWEPLTGRLWTVVNERDGLGDETPPDYLTSVSDGGFYGWPYCYWARRSTSACRRTPHSSHAR